MKHFIFPACFVVAMVAGCSRARNPILERPEIGVVRVHSSGVNGGAPGEGRGFFVSGDGLLVTTRHALGGGGAITVTPSTGATLAGEIVQEDETADVALVRVRANVGFPFLLLNPADVEPGLHVRVIGVNGAAMGVFNQWDDFGRAMEITAHVGPADGGSPLLADDGSVVGVVRGPVAGEPTGQRATPAWRVLRMMPTLVAPLRP